MNNQQQSKRETNPRQNANFLSILTYCWIIPIFFKGLKKELDEEDLYSTLEAHKSRALGDKLERAWMKEKKSQKRPSLLRALSTIFGLELALHAFVFVFLEALKIAQPLALSQLLSFYTHRKLEQQWQSFIYAGAIVGIYFATTLISHWYSLNLQHLGMKVRVACCSLIYRKSLKLGNGAIGGSVGQMVNLLSNDVNKFDKAVVHIHSLWFVPIETGTVIYLLYALVGAIPAIGVLFLTLLLPMQVYLGKRIASLRLDTALQTDKRIQLMNEIISGIQVIKMYTWENKFTKLVGKIRELEVAKIKAATLTKGVMLSISLFAPSTAIFIIVLLQVLSGNPLKAEYVFVTTSFYNFIKQAVTRYYPQGICQISEAKISISRLEKFLACEETPATYNTNNHSRAVRVALEKVSAKWCQASKVKTLDEITFSIEGGGITAIVGQVGSGKTSVLSAILKELPLEEGRLLVDGKVSYSSQEPWMFAGTIRQNILFGQSMDRARYQRVIEVCALEEDFALLPFGDETLVGDRGVNLSGGQRARVNLARAIYYDADIYLLDDPLSAVDSRVGKKMFESCFEDFLKDKCVILVTHQLQYLRNVKSIIQIDFGKISTDPTFRDMGKIESKVIINDESESGEKVWNPVQNGECQNEVKEHRTKGKITMGVYRSYFKAGGYRLLLFSVLLFVFIQIFASGADYFVAFWINLDNSPPDPSKLSKETCTYIYIAIISSLIFFTLTRCIVYVKYCMKVSKILHYLMLSNIIHVGLHFFNANSSGRILNRFSKDMGVIDEILPLAIMECIQVGLSVLGVTAVITVINPWLLFATAVNVLFFYGLKIVYLSTSRSVKRLEGITRSPVFTHMNASLQGLTTIRVFNAQNILQKEFDDYQDVHSSAWYLFLTCSTAFGFWLDLICVVYIGIVTFSSLFYNNDQHGGNLGLAVTQAISLMGIFQWGMRQWSDLENQMSAVERVNEYTKIEKESDRGAQLSAPENWPKNGKISFKDLSLKYSPTNPYVLNQLSFAVEPKEKVGIVGRTGAGKSSIIQALFQLAPTEGAIIIDDLDIAQIPLSILRSKISIIPQEPVLFSGTLRKNLDPFKEYTDLDLWSVLEEVELKKLVAGLPSNLSENISDRGTNFSVGQRQLICLARAMLRKNKILVLDEATANLDCRTDALIQKTIRRKFADCTVLTIAHRLHTIMDSDRILVMENGKVAEFDRPHVLAQNKSSVFFTMVEKTDAEQLI